MTYCRLWKAGRLRTDVLIELRRALTIHRVVCQKHFEVEQQLGQNPFQPVVSQIESG